MMCGWVGGCVCVCVCICVLCVCVLCISCMCVVYGISWYQWNEKGCGFWEVIVWGLLEGVGEVFRVHEVQKRAKKDQKYDVRHLT